MKKAGFIGTFLVVTILTAASFAQQAPNVISLSVGGKIKLGPNLVTCGFGSGSQTHQYYLCKIKYCVDVFGKSDPWWCEKETAKWYTEVGEQSKSLKFARSSVLNSEAVQNRTQYEPKCSLIEVDPVGKIISSNEIATDVKDLPDLP